MLNVTPSSMSKNNIVRFRQNTPNTLIGKVPNMIMNGVAINNASDAKEQKNNLSSQNGATVMGNTFVSDLGCS